MHWRGIQKSIFCQWNHHALRTPLEEVDVVLTVFQVYFGRIHIHRIGSPYRLISWVNSKDRSDGCVDKAIVRRIRMPQMCILNKDGVNIRANKVKRGKIIHDRVEPM